jgi:hypothetical protein
VGLLAMKRTWHNRTQKVLEPELMKLEGFWALEGLSLRVMNRNNIQIIA